MSKITKLNLADVLAEVESHQKDQLLSVKLYRIVEAAVKPFDGKEISKRIANAIAKALPEYTVSYEPQYNLYQVKVWGNGIEYDKRLSFFLGYATYPYFCFSTTEKNKNNFVESNACHWLDEERHARLEKNKANIPGWVERWNAAVDSLEEVEIEIGHDLYPLTRLMRL